MSHENEDAGATQRAPMSWDEAIEVLERFGRNLSALAEQGGLDPVVGRTYEVERAVEILCRRNQNIPLLIADPGIETVSTMEGLALRIVAGDVPASLNGLTVIWLDAVEVERQARDLDMSSDVRTALAVFAESGHGLLCLDQFQLLGTAGADTMSPLMSTIRNLLLGGRMSAVGATSMDDVRRAIEGDDAMRGAVQSVQVDEPTVAHTIELLKGQRSRYEAFHETTITDEALIAAAVLANIYITDRFLPDSAADLLDEAGGAVRTRQVAPSPEMLELDAWIADVRTRKELAIDGQDFEAAARLRDEEKKVISRKRAAVDAWRRESDDLVLEIDEELIVDITARRVRRDPDELLRKIHGPRVESTPVEGLDASELALLNDAPLSEDDKDLLKITGPADNIANLLLKAPTPFTFAVDGSWGMGKSSLLRRIDQAMTVDPAILRVHFNAWTAQGDTALEALIKSVLYNLDSNVFRRTIKRLRSRNRILGLWRLATLLVMRFIGGQRFVDRLWDYFGGDDSARNELKTVIQGMLKDWVDQSPTGSQSRRIVVFIDDLDRCSDDVVVRICEAMRLYLDAPGLQFVVACDMSVLARGVADAARGTEGAGRTYLEKVVQVVYHLPPADHDVMSALVNDYAGRAGVGRLFQDPTIDLLIDRSSGNPRRIKRIINSFVLEYRLDRSWGDTWLSTSQLMRVVILRHLYPEFLAWTTHVVTPDPVGEFLDYAAVRRNAADPPAANVRWWATASRLFQRYGIPPVERTHSAVTDIRERLQQLEQQFPSEFPMLAQDTAFCDFLEGLGDRDDRTILIARLMTRPSAVLGDFLEASSSRPEEATWDARSASNVVA